MKQLKKFITNRIVLTVLGIVFVFLIWEMISLTSKNPTMIFPTPKMTIEEALFLLGKEYTYRCIWGTLKRTLIGFSFALLGGILLGFLVGNFIKTKYFFNPLLTVVKTIPTAALVLLFLVMIGSKNTPMFIVFIISFPIIYESCLGGFSNIDKDLLMALKVDGATFFKGNIMVKFPLAFPYLAVGIASSFALSFKIAIMAEVISGTTSPGLGSIIKASQNNDPTNMVPIFGYSLIAIVLALLTSLIFYLVKSASKIDFKNN